MPERNPPRCVHRILLIDDNASIHGDFRKVLGGEVQDAGRAALAMLEADLFGDLPQETVRPRFEIHSAYQGREGVEMARAAHARGEPYAVSFVDMRMPPGWDGLKTIEQLWKADPDIQVVICSAHSNYDWSEVVDGLNYSDKLLVLRKPAEPVEILQSATALSRKWQNERLARHRMDSLEQVIKLRTHGLEAANRQLRHLATHDALTSLPNRLLLHDRLEQAVAHADRGSRPFALMVCSLDRFKLVNESLGHSAGDKLLQEIGRRLAKLAGPVDTVARFGGDEFILLINSLNQPDDALEVAARAVDAVQEPVCIGGVDVRTSASIGIALYPADAATAEALAAHAEAAMHRAKQRGRGGVQRFERGMSASVEERVRLESDLHGALAQGQFQLYYQPKVHTATGSVRSAEALIRWIHPQRGLISPDAFIPLAEECGLIDAIGEWVAREACRQARVWQDRGLAPLRVSVNLSPSQFRGSGLADSIRGALEEARLDPQYFEVELTESAVMSDPEESIAILEQLSAMGILVSVDDFGTGYSSMSYLRRFPIDKLKIDRVFISEIASRPEDASIVRAIVSLAHSLRLKVVAEGVETREQLEFLKAIGCDEYQGYHFSRPLPASEFERLVRENAASSRPLTQEDALRTHSKLAAYRRK
ncbi:MAG TPA: EAL domain-containing protein [Steroidobacteraceae bacterium]|nr:EAL domain-containing protein [Steroidobacteraceae bacterium]